MVGRSNLGDGSEWNLGSVENCRAVSSVEKPPYLSWVNQWGKQEPSHGVELPCRETAVAAAVWGHTNRPGRLELPPLALCVISPNPLPQPVLVQKPQATQSTIENNCQAGETSSGF